MKAVIQIVLVLLCIVITYFIYESIMSPIRKAKEIEQVETKIIERLKKGKEAQMAFKDITGKFASNWDTLQEVMRTGQLKIIQRYSVESETGDDYEEKEILISLYDSLFGNKFSLDSIAYVPNTGKKFLIDAGEITQNEVKVPVFQITDPFPFDEERVKNNTPLRVGNMESAEYGGNWR